MNSCKATIRITAVATTNTETQAMVTPPTWKVPSDTRRGNDCWRLPPG
jgi:hypothetical protein